MSEVLEAPKRQFSPEYEAQKFKPGQPRTGGRQKLTPNKDRSVTIARIVKLADPIGVLCDIASGKKIWVAPEPGAARVECYPTMADRLTALTVLARKVMPDLRQVSVEDGGQLVNVVLQLGQKVTVEAPTK